MGFEDFNHLNLYGFEYNKDDWDFSIRELTLDIGLEAYVPTSQIILKLRREKSR